MSREKRAIMEGLAARAPKQGLPVAMTFKWTAPVNHIMGKFVEFQRAKIVKLSPGMLDVVTRMARANRMKTRRIELLMSRSQRLIVFAEYMESIEPLGEHALLGLQSDEKRLATQQEILEQCLTPLVCDIINEHSFDLGQELIVEEGAFHLLRLTLAREGEEEPFISLDFDGWSGRLRCNGVWLPGEASVEEVEEQIVNSVKALPELPIAAREAS